MRRLAAVLSLALLAPVPAPASAEVDTRTVNDGNVVLEGVPEVPPEIGNQLQRYQNTRSAGFQDWTEDGEGIYISTRFGNVSQLHRVSAPGGARTQLTFFDEPAGGADRQPGGSALTFLMDAGGNEFRQIFLLDPASGDSRLLSDGESQWSRPVEPRRQPDRLPEHAPQRTLERRLGDERRRSGERPHGLRVT